MRGFHQAVLDCHAQFGGDLESMQRLYDAATPKPSIQPSDASPNPTKDSIKAAREEQA